MVVLMVRLLYHFFGKDNDDGSGGAGSNRANLGARFPESSLQKILES